MIRFNCSFLLVFLLLSFFSLSAAPSAELLLCVMNHDEEFQIYTEDAEEAKKLGFTEQFAGNFYFRPFKLLIDGEPHTAFKPDAHKKSNCLRAYDITPGKHSVSLDFKSVSYTALETVAPYTSVFKPKVLNSGKIYVAKGGTAKVSIQQSEKRVRLFQALTNKPVPDCEKSCEIPAGIPIYFVESEKDEKVLCQPEFKLVLENEREKSLSCYSRERILKVLNDYIHEENILCTPNVETAFFLVFGEGCIIFLAADQEGLGALPPQIRLVPLSERKIKYFIRINSQEKHIYSFGDNKKFAKIPEKDELIELIEEKEE